MKKDFKNWNNKKEQLNDIERRPFFHEQEIWYCYLGANVGSEKYYYSFSFISKIKSIAIISQIRLIDAQRLGRNIGIMTDSDFRNLTKKLRALLP